MEAVYLEKKNLLNFILLVGHIYLSLEDRDI